MFAPFSHHCASGWLAGVLEQMAAPLVVVPTQRFGRVWLEKQEVEFPTRLPTISKYSVEDLWLGRRLKP